MRPAEESAAAPAPDPIQDEVLANIRGQRIGAGTCAEHTVADLHLAEPFLRRVADRIIRSSFEERFRQVVHDRPPAEVDGAQSPGASDAASDPVDLPFEVLRTGGGLHAPVSGGPDELRPALRGYRAPLGAAAADWPMESSASFSSSEKDAAAYVARRLASDGLLRTLEHLLPRLGLSGDPRADQRAMDRLRSVGLPVDLLPFFEPEFRFRPSCPDFRAASEAGERDPAAIRLHLTRGDYWDGPHSGSNLAVVRDLVAALPETAFLIHIHERHLATLASQTRSWPESSRRRITVAPTGLPVSQWAQDNAKPGFALASASGPELVTLLPRYASRSEDAPTLVPGDTLALEALSAWDRQRPAQSPLLFQGGNLAVVYDPGSGERVLLLGEAEVHRNTTLGLSPQQVMDAFKAEMRVDRCITLPAASFHIDYELTVRAVSDERAGSGARPVAFVNDTGAAARIIITCCIRAMERHRFLNRRSADGARRFLARADAPSLYRLLVPPITTPTATGPVVSESLIPVFSAGEGDSGVGNIHRFLLAMDFLLAMHTDPAGLPIDPHFRSYLTSFRRREADRAAMARTVAELGWGIVPVPSTSEGKRSINYLNGIHTAQSYLMPAWGGLFSTVDEVAAGAFRRHLGRSVNIVPIACAESQRRSGALHCSASVYPRSA